MNTFSVDAETNGLWGQIFAIGACVGDKIFYERCPIDGNVNTFVQENIIPVLKNMPETCANEDELLKKFAQFYMENKEGANVVTHVGFPVETGLFHKLHEKNFIGDWDAPFPIYDISTMLLMVGENPTEQEEFKQKVGIEVDGNSHDPLYDARVTARIFQYILAVEIGKRMPRHTF